MSLILHLSDLHLGSPTPGQFDVVDKVGVADIPGPSQKNHLGHTLEAVGKALADAGRQLDSIVISGDLTRGNHEDGYAEFDQFMQKLGSCRPDEGRIVVVPGNHDVDSTLEPGDPKKLERFRVATRHRFSTPLINGVDYLDGKQLNPGPRGRPEPIVDLGDAVIVAINSADYCWTTEGNTKTEWSAVLDAYRQNCDEDVDKQAVSDLDRLRNYDIPKVDQTQIDALGKRLDAIKVGAGNHQEDKRLRIAVLHHPIGVVTDQEEIKPFAVITNLAELRTFLCHRGFHLILHGHKHRSYAGWDWLAPPREDLDETIPHRALVLGASGQFLIGKPAMRLIEISPDGDQPVAGAPRLRVTDIHAVEPSQPVVLEGASPIRSLAQPFMSSLDRNTPWVVKAKSADAAYQQLHDLPGDSEVPRAVISVVEDPDSTSKLPTNYAKTEVSLDLGDLVDWWQLPRPEAIAAFSGSRFNHGERLYGSGDAVARAVKALPSSKAIALLTRAEEAGKKLEWPAFVVVQLQARKREEAGHHIDVVGIYRKQDLELWWPINMGELARIQKRAVELAQNLDKKQLAKPITAGHLIAITTSGVHDDVLPQMAGTLLDREVDLRPERIYQLADLALHPRPESEGDWKKAFEDIGDREGHGLLVPSIGIERLKVALEMHLKQTNTPELRRLVKCIAALAEKATKISTRLKDVDKRTIPELDDAGEELKTAVKAVQSALRVLLKKGPN